MHKTQNEQKTKPNPDDYAKRMTGTVLFTSSVARAECCIIPLLTIKYSAALRYTALCIKFCYVWQHCLQAATSGVAQSGLA
jgi:hypothetical protein